MGSSAKKKKDKKKDFQKPKLRVGKTKTKADNFTDTSFKSKSIVLNQQSLTTSAPSASTQFTHNLSLVTSKSDSQRRDALSHLTTVLSSFPVTQSLPVSTALILPQLLPLILDGSNSVRTQLLRLLRLLPAHDVANRSESALLYIRAGMTHLAPEIRNDALNTLEWLLEAGGEDVLSCPGGWVKTLNAFLAMMGWGGITATSKWSSAPKAMFGKGGAGFPKQILLLAQFLKIGLGKQEIVEGAPHEVGSCGIWDLGVHDIPERGNAFAYLNLFGAVRDEEGEIYAEREARQRVFGTLFLKAIQKGVESTKKEGGELGRAAAILGKVIVDGMRDYENEG